MDLHPMIVHFPVALLTVYALLEIARLPMFRRSVWWFPVKTVFLLLGWLGSVAAVTTGLTTSEAARITGEWPKLIAVHKNFGIATLVVFGVIALAYVFAAQKKDNAFSKFILRAPVVIPLALLGLAFVTITGALGGAMAYGADVDPVVSIMYKLFVGGK